MQSPAQRWKVQELESQEEMSQEEMSQEGILKNQEGILEGPS